MFPKYETFLQIFQFWSISNIDTAIPHPKRFPVSLAISLIEFLSCSSSVPLFYHTRFDYTPQIFDIRKHMPIQTTQIQLCTNHIKFWFKHTTHQKAESLWANFFSKLDNVENNNSIFSTKCEEILQNFRRSLIFKTLLEHTTIPTISTKNPLLHFSQFSPPFFPLSCSQNHPYNSQ